MSENANETKIIYPPGHHPNTRKHHFKKGNTGNPSGWNDYVPRRELSRQLFVQDKLINNMLAEIAGLKEIVAALSNAVIEMSEINPRSSSPSSLPSQFIADDGDDDWSDFK